MELDIPAFSAGLSVVLLGFFMAWVVGLVARMLEIGGE